MASSSSSSTYRQAKDWNAAQYLKFEAERTRPVRDLVAQIPLQSPRRVVDLGCGPGNSTGVLLARWPEAHITGMDSSPDMIQKARSSFPQLGFELSDLADWTPTSATTTTTNTTATTASPGGEQVDVFFSNAVFQWIPYEQRLPLMSRYISMQASGGVFAIQMPDNFMEPSHVLMRETAAEEGSPWSTILKERQPALAQFQTAQEIYDHLSPLCQEVNLWHTHYYHILDSHEAVVEWVKGTGLRPFLDPLSDEDRVGFVASYLAKLKNAYPVSANGKVILKYPRLFVVAVRK